MKLEGIPVKKRSLKGVSKSSVRGGQGLASNSLFSEQDRNRIELIKLETRFSFWIAPLITEKEE
jgi:hypothetical protein|uniref:Uncharacterized protein n=1 Tax=Picea glauca TaxID=3330 RepID=A0A101M3R6_PICGL|nr:hypothetical protein ABT39_MTgene359 [Picea glauca]QHR86505.1 hypothetical protein Q903MT_gene507 [Picea sitchensis]